jgi:N utilization substance protein B
MKRSEIREAAFYLTFESLFHENCPDGGGAQGGEDIVDLIIEANNEADIFEIPVDAVELFKNVSSKSDELDAIISEHSEKRQFGRIPRVNVAILRIALYEFLFDDRVPGNVAISEAVLLAKKFAFENDVQFINGVLGEFSRNRSLQSPQPDAKP